MHIESVAIADLRYDPDNARRHPDSNLTAIQASLSQFGQQKPIIVTHDGTVVAGNGTLQAATGLGWTHISVKRVPESWDANTVKAFALADNRSAELAQWDATELMKQLDDLSGDFDMELFGFEVPDDIEIDLDDVQVESRGLGTPIIHYDIIFDNETQQAKWFQFMRKLRAQYPEAETLAERLTAYIEGEEDE